MAYFSFLDEPVAADAPCGVDVDDDPGVQSFFMILEGSLPSSYLGFDRKAFEDKKIITELTQHLKKSRDVRLLVMAIKTFALAENLAGFFETLAGMTKLLENHWEDVHPRGVNGDYALRAAYVQSLEDRATLMLPLQAAPLIKDKRLGNLSFRSFLLAKSPASIKEGETAHDEGTLNDAFMRHEPIEDIIELRNQAKGAKENFSKLRNLFIDKVSHESAPQFEHVPGFLDELAAKLGTFIADRTPAEAEISASEQSDNGVGLSETVEVSGTHQKAPAGPVADPISVKEASAALQAVLVYYTAHEPSSPAKLLVRQAYQLVGKSFVEAMQILAPDLIEKTRIDMAGGMPFSLNFAQLQALAENEQQANEVDDVSAREYSVKSRNEASETMKSVERFYRQFEPSSPIPLLLDRARKFVARDFASLLTEMAKQTE
jgi:type VI secretion system protein ImpA